MTFHRLLAGSAIMLAIVSTPYLTLCFIPDKVIHQAADQKLAPLGLTAQSTRLERIFPFGLTACNVVISDRAGPRLRLNSLSLRPRLPSLLAGRLELACAASLGTGRLAGAVTVWPGFRAHLEAEGIELTDIPMIIAVGNESISGTAFLELDVWRNGALPLEGSLKLRVKSLSVQHMRLKTLVLPAMTFSEAAGAMKLVNSMIVVDSLSFTGSPGFLRLNGQIPVAAADRIDLALELMPTAEYLNEQSALFKLLSPFQTAPGNYRLSIGGTLSSPLIISR